jgi:hypothetical protein
VKLAQNSNTTVSATNPGGWGRGDFNYDGVIDFNDVVKLAQNFNTGPAAGPVSVSAPVQRAAVPIGVGTVRPASGSVARRRASRTTRTSWSSVTAKSPTPDS